MDHRDRLPGEVTQHGLDRAVPTALQDQVGVGSEGSRDAGDLCDKWIDDAVEARHGCHLHFVVVRHVVLQPRSSCATRQDAFTYDVGRAVPSGSAADQCGDR
ncbi:hypothetical protein SDC9_143807 [bioreactor metagenome]|uniref:Uncharacterized protein n=1 Tax=bioreactor metagenome TaxID=1076179 RepID=A0A645E7P7_9ZZZZ